MMNSRNENMTKYQARLLGLFRSDCADPDGLVVDEYHSAVVSW